MSMLRGLSLAGGILILGCGSAWSQVQDDAPLRLEPPLSTAPADSVSGAPTPRAPDPQVPPRTPATSGALPPRAPDPQVPPRTPATNIPPRTEAVDRVSQAPPAPLAEGPKGKAPTPGARWTAGYWDYDTGRGQYAWVAGSWRVPPPGKDWVNDTWQRDERGWYRVPGSWRAVQQEGVADWRRSGPPADRPDETVGPAPSPNAFYIPGNYMPKDGRVVWRAGYWAAGQPGWEWIPARWVRLAEGFDYREGYWNRVDNDPGQPARGDRHVVARPSADPGTRPVAGGATDLEPIPDQDVARAGVEPGQDTRPPAAEDRRTPDQPDPGVAAEVPQTPAVQPGVVDPRLIGPAPVVIRQGLPVPYWDGGRLVVPPTRFGPGVVVDAFGSPVGSPYPMVGVLPPRGPSPGVSVVVPRGGVFGGRVRGLFNRVLP